MAMKMVGVSMKTTMIILLFMAVATMPMLARAIDIPRLRQMAARSNVTCMLVFGDSTVDPGNNNRLMTSSKSNYPPYGKSNFFHGRPTGRFSNGRLATDFIAEALFTNTNTIPGFLYPNLMKEDILHGVSFASAASGYDDLTANLSNVLTLSQQLKYFLHYKIHMRQLVGEEASQQIIKNSIFLISMGTNDFLLNYYLEPTRSKTFTIEQYQNYLISQMLQSIKELRKLGATRLAVVGVPPMGCLPLVKTIMDQTKCVNTYNKVALSFNSKIQATLATLNASFRMKSVYVDIYRTIQSVVNDPKKYGLTETVKGCCGTGMIEYGDSCKGLNTCADPNKYVFWDAVHPTEKMYQIIADDALDAVGEVLLS